MLPDRIEIMGRWYVAEDTIAPKVEQLPQDKYEPIRPLCKEFGIDPHKAYDAIRDGSLDARIPNGNVRGMKCKRSDFARWYEDEAMVRC